MTIFRTISGAQRGSHTKGQRHTLWDLPLGRGSESDMKYHILHVFRTSIEFINKSSDHFKDIYNLKLLTSFHVNTTSFLKGVPNYVLNL